MPRLTGFSHAPVPGPRPVPLLGHMPRAFQFLQDPIAAIVRLRPYGDVVGVAAGSPALVCVFGPEHSREVLSNPAEFRNDEDFINGPEGSSFARMSKTIISINGEEHRRHRRLMAPAFSRAALDGYADAIVRATEATIARWPFGSPVDLDVLVRELVLTTTLRTLFGLDTAGGEDELGRVGIEMVRNLSSPLGILAPFNLPGLPYRRALRAGDRLVALLDALIAQKRRGGASDDALSLLIHATGDETQPFTDVELMSEAATLFFAGHETTAETLTWTMFLLERHPEVLAGAQAEVDAVLGERTVTAADIPRLPLLDRILKESMRVLPPVPLLFLRVVARSRTLGVPLPAGANVVVSPYAAHHDEERFPEPERFLPSRWETITPGPYEYFPFGAGPRSCLGTLFAQQALRLILPTLLQRVRIAVRPNARIARMTRGNILMPRHGIPVQLERTHRRRIEPAPVRGDIHEMVTLAR